MLSSESLVEILRESASRLRLPLNTRVLESVQHNRRNYGMDELAEFKRDLIEAGKSCQILIKEYEIPLEGINSFQLENLLAMAFTHDAGDIQYVFLKGGYLSKTLLQNSSGNITALVFVAFNSLVSEDDEEFNKEIKPVKRFFKLLATERKDIGYILFYAIVIGIISLVLPLGIQTTIELISGGVFFSSVYVLIAFVILGVLLTGALQIVQITLVEHLQRRIFTKAAFEFAFRIPRLKTTSLNTSYAPELVNRFFDVMTIQKGLPKLLIDLFSGAIQIFFGLVLLSLYHPFFVFFSAVLVTVLVLIFYFTGPTGLSSSLNESKYKYKVVFWFEELARAINSFKLAGNSNLPIQRADYLVNNYLKFRKNHFKILRIQFSFVVLFKGIVTAGLLIMGTILVVSREITLGQFVASEIVIILILNAVEKVIMYMDVVYDMLTAVDKVGHITDLPLERQGGFDLPVSQTLSFAVDLKNVSYRYEDKKNYTLHDINLSIAAGERVCICGSEGSGKTTLTKIIAGLQDDYQGSVTINNFSLHDLDLTHLRNNIAKNISPEDIFDGTILENITLGKTDKTMADAVEAIRQAGVHEKINSLPNGLHTHILSGGKGLSSSMVHRLILARCFAKKPGLIILNDFFSGLTKSDKLDLIQRIVDKSQHWTVITESNDPAIMSACDRVIIVHDGKIEAQGRFEDLIHDVNMKQYLE